ncbi:DUF317 domain-containing protein [Streptomyces sp. NPDC087856]|uniref:DUF317 domain-containing protein n=1 Tax=Streptomyces sp. NPDC087856 TaxID=3365811 RepID=UPI003820E34C
MSTQLPYDQRDFQDVLVSPRYLAGSNGSGEAGFAPVAHWPHHHLDEGPCQLLVTSPDKRIRIGWFGDDFELWKITASQEAASATRWTATFNHVTPAEIVAGLTTALAHDYAEADAYEGNGRFLASPSLYWADAVRPLTEAGWRRAAAERGTVEIIAPDGQAGVLIDNRLSSWDDENVTLWAGPPGWGTRAEAVFTARTPSHLIAATAAAMTNPTPVIRERHQLAREITHLATLTPVSPTAPVAPRAPTPLDVRRTAVTQAVHRAARAPQTAADLSVMAARSHTATSAQTRSSNPTPAPGVPSAVPSAPRRSR